MTNTVGIRTGMESDVFVGSIGVLLNVSAEDTLVHGKSKIVVDIGDTNGNPVNGSLVLSFDDGTPDAVLQLNGTVKTVEYVYDNANISKIVNVPAAFNSTEHAGYAYSENSTKFNVGKVKTRIGFQADYLRAHQESFIIFTLYYIGRDSAEIIQNESLKIMINDEIGNILFDDELLTDSNGEVKVTFTPISGADLSIAASFDGDSEKMKYNSTQTILELGVNAMSADSDMDVEGAFIDHNGNITVNLADANGNPVTGGKLVLNFSDGTESMEIPIDGSSTSYSFGFNNTDFAKNVTVTVTFIPEQNSGYNGFHKDFIFIVDRIKTMIAADNISVQYNEENYLEVTLKDMDNKALSGLNLSVFLMNLSDYITDGDGKIFIPTKDLDVNKYYLWIDFKGNEMYQPSRSVASINVEDVVPVRFIDTELTVTVTNISYGDVEVISFTLRDKKGNPLTGKINVTVGERTEEANVTNGEGSIEIRNLSADTYPVVANFQGNATHGASVGTNYFKVSRNGTQIIFEDMNTTAVAPSDGKIGEWFYFTLKDANGRPLANTPMQIGFNGVVYTYEKDGICTDENGIAKLQINLGYRGDYTFAICYLGDENYKASFAVAKITVKEQTPTLTVPDMSYAIGEKTKTLTATFKTEYGNPIANKWITFTVNGKIYKGKTNENGIVSVKISIAKPGTYAVVANYVGDSTYNAVNQTAILNII